MCVATLWWALMSVLFLGLTSALPPDDSCQLANNRTSQDCYRPAAVADDSARAYFDSGWIVALGVWHSSIGPGICVCGCFCSCLGTQMCALRAGQAERRRHRTGEALV